MNVSATELGKIMNKIRNDIYYDKASEDSLTEDEKKDLAFYNQIFKTSYDRRVYPKLLRIVINLIEGKDVINDLTRYSSSDELCDQKAAFFNINNSVHFTPNMSEKQFSDKLKYGSNISNGYLFDVIKLRNIYIHICNMYGIEYDADQFGRNIIRK